MSSFVIGTRISLINLGQQLEFVIDDDYKNKICFAETLVISCGHTGGVFEDNDEEESEFTCSESKESTAEEATPEEKPVEIVDFVPEPEVIIEEEDVDFHTFFFPDCKEPKPSHNSECSIITVDGWPAVSPTAHKLAKCTCLEEPKDKDKCECFTKLPCKCGARRKKLCTCNKLENICICDEGHPKPKCDCAKANICTCFKGMPRVKCTCDKVEKPCICQYSGLPKPECDCKTCSCFPYIKYPKMVCDCDLRVFEQEICEEEDFCDEENIDESSTSRSTSNVSGNKEPVPCICQKPDPVPPCLCQKGRECTCKLQACICGVQKNCVCETTESQEAVCKSQESRSICSCPEPRECTCDAKENDCQCFPKPGVCTCGDPANCRCKLVCECAVPCICDTASDKDEGDECVCLDKVKTKEGVECQCICKKIEEEKNRKLKKVRAGKHGYRWCNDVDPLHTYFDYSYGKHDKIDYKEQEKEKFKILGLHDVKEEKLDDGKCPAHPKATFERKVRKPTIDCCSAVGGISINVESLGEERDKFLIQVVSHASKEGAKTGSKLVSIVDCNLHTMEENRIEHISKNNLTKERRSYMALCENGYYNKITHICGERNIVKRFYHNFDVAHDFLLEGSNIVLLRYLGLKRYKGRVKTSTVLIDGTICESNYVCLGTNQAIVNGRNFYVYKVERHVIEPSGVVHLTRTTLTLKGYTVSHEWADSSYLFHINPLLKVVPEKDEIETHAPLRENWRKDLQLFSDYLDFKSMRTSEGAGYIEENGELTATVRDYLQALLLLKPADVVHFTRHYFQSAISALDLPHDEYFDPCPKHVRYFYLED